MKPVAACAVALLLLWNPVAPALAREDCGKPFSEIFALAAPAVVSVFAVSFDAFSLSERVRPRIGSGILLDGGRILTNAHLVFDSRVILIDLGDNDVHPAERLGFDPISDLAVLRLVDGVEPGRAAAIGDSESLLVGEEVMAIGNPLGLGLTATRGIVSAVHRIVPRSSMSWRMSLVQTDAPISPGNSGGPLIDRCGEVVAINTIHMRDGENIGFAIPINQAMALVPQLIEKGHAVRPWHGINGKMINGQLQFLLGLPFAQGLLIETIEPGSPAEEIGLKSGSFPVRLGTEEYILGGDIIIRVNGTMLTDVRTAVGIVRGLEVGQTLELDVLRDGQMLHRQLTLPERPVLEGDIRLMQTPGGG